MNQDEVRYTILIVDDSVANIDILVGLLGNLYDVLVALDGPGALDMVADEHVDLILLDIMMPGMSGFDVCRELKQDSSTRDIPVIFLTAKSDEASIEQAYEVGGIDYVTKPFKRVELLARIRTQLRLRSLVQDLEHLANHDSLTGIYNRRRFFELATELFKQGREVCAAMIDIDNFKAINDRYGHGVGDIVIRLTAATISEHLDDGFVFGRLGGEEFAIVNANIDAEHFYATIEAIRAAIETLNIACCDDPPRCRISTGIAAKTDNSQSIDSLLRNADVALYQAKTSGKNRTVRNRD